MQNHLFHGVKKSHILTACSLAALLSVLYLFFCGIGSLYDSNLNEQEKILTQALSQSITECYALEGRYPADISYLIDNYGLTYDSSRFLIDYQYIGANLRPDVTIIKRKTS